MSLTAKSISSKQWDSEAAMRKAEYLFLQSIYSWSEDELDDYCLMVQRANRLSPEDIDIAGHLGFLTFAMEMDSNDTMKIERAYQQVRALFLSNPKDYDNGNTLAQMATKLRRFDDIEMVWKYLDSIYPNRNEPALYLSKVYLTKYLLGDTASFNRAIAIYNRLEDGYGIDPGISSYKIRAYSLRRDTASIVRELNHLETALPSNAEAMMFIGQTYSAFEMNDSALVYFDKACALDSISGEIYLVRADFFDKLGDSESYDREVFHALASPTLEFDDKMDLMTHYVANLYKDKSQRPRIESLFNTIQEVNPGEARVHQLYAAYLAEMGDNERAAEQYSYSISLDPTIMDNWSYLMSAHYNLKQYEKVVEVGKEAIQRFDTTILFPLMTINALRQLDRAQEAVDLLNNFDISKFDNNVAISNYYSSLGDMYYAVGNTDSAFSSYEKALEANPENYMAMNNIAYYICVSDSANIEKAERYATMAVRAEPHNTSALDTYAWIKFKQKDFKTAREYIDKALAEYGLHGTPNEWIDNIEADSIPDSDYDVAEVNQPSSEGNDDLIKIDDLEEVAPVTMDMLAEELGAEFLEHCGDIYFMTGEPDTSLEYWKLALGQSKDNELLKKKVKHKTYFFK